MKNFKYMFLIITALLIFACQAEPPLTAIDQNDPSTSFAKKPAASLTGSTYVPFTLTPPTFWNGTVDFGVVGKYSITFFSFEPPRDYSNASPFEEEFVIYKLNSDWSIPENVYLRAWNKGVTTLGNDLLDPAKFVANGKVDEAHGPFEGWQGRNVHIAGTFTWAAPGLPDLAIGSLRLN